MTRFIKRKDSVLKAENEYIVDVYLIIDTETNKEYELDDEEDVEAIVKILNERR